MRKKLIIAALISFSVFIVSYGDKQIRQFIPTNTGSLTNIKLLAAQSKNNSTEDGMKYQLTNQVYNNKNVTIYYPQIMNLGDSSKQKRINKIIKDDALRLFNSYKASGEEFSLEINYAIKLQNMDILSIQYSGLSNFKGSAHPSNLFFTTNIDINNARKIRLNELVNIDETFVKKLREGKYVTSSQGSTELKNAIYMELNRLTDNELIKMLKNADTVNSESFSFLTNDSLGISISVPHPVGDHAEFEIKYQNLNGNIKHENKIWSKLLK